MSYWRDNHGNIYGPFSKQDDGFPNAGEVVRFYREKMKLSQTRLALLLGVNRLWIIKMENQNKVPELLSRRRAIADLLKIPPVLLGVSALSSDTFLELVESHTSSRSSVAPYSLQEANEYLDAVWELHRFTGSPDTLPSVQRWKARINEEVTQKARDENLDLLNRYELFLLEVGRDKNDYTGTDSEKLVNLARQLDNPDTLGFSLYRRGRMHFEKQDYENALRDIKEALSEVENAGPQVKGFVLVGSGTVLAYDATTKDDVQKVMKNLDKAYRCIESANSYLDPFHTGFNESRYFIARACSITSLLRHDPTLINEVWEALELAQEQPKPKSARFKSNMEFRYAEAAFHAELYLSAVDTALDALEMAKSINLQRDIVRIQKLYNKLTQTKIKDSSELRKLRIALTKKSSPIEG